MFVCRHYSNRRWNKTTKYRVDVMLGIAIRVRRAHHMARAFAFSSNYTYATASADGYVIECGMFELHMRGSARDFRSNSVILLLAFEECRAAPGCIEI